ncbi:MAG TPA: M12 family metallo-peptidase, partial [Lysobacter sp.]|nr:M12 family metallo-peptidase [Lysobacter sp.]
MTNKVFFVLAALLLSSCSSDWSAGLADKRASSSVASSTDSIDPAGAISPPIRAHAARSFANAPDRGSLVQYPQNPVVRRSGAYTWHAADLSEDHALRSTITGNLSFTAPDGTPINLAYERHIEHPDGNWSWIGRAEGERGESTVITFGEEAVFGTIPQSRDQPPLRLTISDGRTWVVSADPRLLREIRNAATHPTDQDFLVPPKLAASAATTLGGMEAMGAEAMATTASGKTVVDVLVGFTNGYATYRGGASAAITRIHNLVEVTNQAYRNSQVNAEVRLVHSMQVSYPDATANKTALEELTGFTAPSTSTTPDPAFSALRSARDQYGADTVVLLRRFQDPENDGCGIAWLIGAGQSGIN